MPEKNLNEADKSEEQFEPGEDGRIIDGLDELSDLQDMEKEREKVAKDQDPLVDPEVEISEQEIDDLEQSAIDTSSDESQAGTLLDDEDLEGDKLNEGPEEEDLFDTGEDLDVAPQDLNPDHDLDVEDN